MGRWRLTTTRVSEYMKKRVDDISEAPDSLDNLGDALTYVISLYAALH